MANVTEAQKSKAPVTATTGKEKAEAEEKWSDDSSDREIISLDKWVEHKLSDQVLEGWGIGEERLKEETEDMKAWDVLIFQLTKPIQNIGEDDKPYPVPAGTNVCISKVFKIAHLAALMTDPNVVYKMRIKLNGEKKLSGPRKPMKLFKIQISDKVGSRVAIAPATVHRLLAAQNAPAALPQATPFD